MYPALYLFTDMTRLQALAFISKAEKNIVVIVPLDERVVYKIVLAHLDVFRSDTLEAWYAYFRTGEAQHFFALMQTLPSDN